jgi:hypothetical protein
MWVWGERDGDRVRSRGQHAWPASSTGLRGGRAGRRPLTLAFARFLREREHEAPLIDLLVIEEAHYMRNPETVTADPGRLLRGVAQYVVLLSATPIHLRNGDLYRLLNLADADLFQPPELLRRSARGECTARARTRCGAGGALNARRRSADRDTGLGVGTTATLEPGIIRARMSAVEESRSSTSRPQHHTK